MMVLFLLCSQPDSRQPLEFGLAVKALYPLRVLEQHLKIEPKQDINCRNVTFVHVSSVLQVALATYRMLLHRTSTQQIVKKVGHCFTGSARQQCVPASMRLARMHNSHSSSMGTSALSQRSSQLWWHGPQAHQPIGEPMHAAQVLLSSGGRVSWDMGSPSAWRHRVVKLQVSITQEFVHTKVATAGCLACTVLIKHELRKKS
jgi:hypothetical protein